MSLTNYFAFFSCPAYGLDQTGASRSNPEGIAIRKIPDEPDSEVVRLFWLGAQLGVRVKMAETLPLLLGGRDAKC